MRFKSSYVLALGVCAISAAWVLSGMIAPSERVRAAPPAQVAPAETPPRAVRVRVAVAEQRDDVLRVVGQTQASRRVDLRSEIDGRIAELPVSRGAAVARNDLVARIAVDDRNARLAEARALLAQRQVELDAARTLARSGHRAEISVAETQARFEGARAAVTRMEVELARTAIRAPFEGIVETRPVELGSYVKAGDPIAVIVDLDPVRIVGNVSERDIARVALGAPARARLTDGRTLDGMVAFVGSVADAGTRTFRVEIEAENPEGRPGGHVVEGLTAELQMPVGTTLAHRITPAILALGDDGVIGVKAVDAESRVVFMPVRLAGTAPDGIWVTGLPERVTLITVGQDYVVPGQRVNAVPEATPAPAPQAQVPQAPGPGRARP
ncbi:MAG: efflux RND transporter periplasmic adaptor subunit [Alphaproteobacteria bacterium]|nr:efflux RND transporter periplasmic adaptor subunit [Alphaproteobacteria bacterium]